MTNANLHKFQIYKTRAFTLVELLVVLFVFAILVSLVVAAAIAAREAARKSQCQHNLRQISLAIANYTSVMGVLPAGSNGAGYSAHTMILPYVEQNVLYNMLNFDLKVLDRINFVSTSNTVSDNSISVFLCPSDGSIVHGRLGTTSYAGNGGFLGNEFGFNGLFTDGSLPRADRPSLSLSAVSDGSSSTALMSEWMMASSLYSSPNRMTDVFKIQRMIKPNQVVEYQDSCKHASEVSTPIAHQKACAWLVGEYGSTILHHTLNPFSNSCTNGSSLNFGIISAASRHGSVVNVSFLDGHVGTVSSNVSNVIWRSMSTRNGSELMPNNY